MTVSKTEVGTSHVFTSWLGPIEYQPAYDLQKPIWAERHNGRREDKLLLLEHPPTLTLGKSGKLKNLLVLQETVIQTLVGFGIGSRRDVKYMSVWVGDDKIVAIGVAMQRWITMHGLALLF